MARYVLDINSNDELPAVIKKCNTNFRSLAKQQQIESSVMEDDFSQMLNGIVVDLTALIDDESTARQSGYDDLENAIETIMNSYLPLLGGTVSGTLILSKRQDASGTANNLPALIIGGTDSQSHIEIDDNEIQAKSNANTPSSLSLNYDGGIVDINGRRVMHGEFANNYWGLMTPEGSSNNWIRTTTGGIIPYTSGGSSSSLGSANWPFNNVRAEHLFAGATQINESATTNGSASSIITMASGFSVVAANTAIWGKMCQFHITFETTNAIASGNITNLLVGTLTSNYRPKLNAVVATTGTGPVGSGYIGTDGKLWISAMGGALSAGGQLSFGGTYILA